jgi:NitT/TauT family transport system ATP-binding protein
MSERIDAGFMPLTDSVLLVVAREFGFARDEGIDLHLVRETSWANIRDRMAVGHFDVAHMLAPMPVASNLRLTPLALPMIAPMALGLGGNAVTVSLELWEAMKTEGTGSAGDPAGAGKALRAVIEARGRTAAPLQFAVVHPHSGHNFELRYWLSACGIDPDRDVEIVIVPPPLMADALASGRIDGFCVGEPWNSVSVAAGSGRIVTIKAAIWKASPEKVLGVSAAWADANEDLLLGLIRALHKAAQFAAGPDNRETIARVLGQRSYLNVDARIIERALAGLIDLGDGARLDRPDFFVPFAGAANFPWKSHALWFYSQMVRSGQLQHSAANATAAAGSYRPDIYRSALGGRAAALPATDMRVEGGGDGTTGFFDGEVFDPVNLDAYIARQSTR